jgi:formylglycine-generating enzyme required for sulfatase activity
VKIRFVSGALAALGLLAAGCQSEPRQWLVSVATDAPVPQLGDHLLLEVLGSDAACTGCLRIIGVDGPESLPVSFGIAPQKDGETVRLRARLYRAEQAGANGLPDSPALIDATVSLPPIDGETRAALDLSTSCFGIASAPDHHETCDPATGKLGPEPVLALLADGTTQPRAGSWPPAAPVACNAAAPAGMVCVPGGAFLLGTPRPTYVGADDARQTQPERLIQLSRFAIDANEVTVGVVRDLVVKGKLPSEPSVKSKSAPGSVLGACTYLGASDATGDALPVNCVSHVLAEAVCAALGKRLPKEAEWEYAAGNVTSETPYPWGASGDLCSLSLVGMGRNFEEADTGVHEGSSCRAVNEPATWGPVVGGNPLDVTTLGIHDLAGSMSEWVADTFAPYGAPCWQSTTSVLVEPTCGAPALGSPSTFSRRGSSWGGFKLDASSTARENGAPSASDPYTGFRCAMSM